MNTTGSAKGLFQIHAKMLEIKEEGTGQYRFRTTAWTDQGKLFGLLSQEDINGLKVGIHPGDIKVEVFETKYGSQLLHRIVPNM